MSDNDSMDLDSMEPVMQPRKPRIRGKSYEKRLQDVHLPSTMLDTLLDEDLPEGSSHFQYHLAHLRQLSLGSMFTEYSRIVYPLSRSMPLLVLNWKAVGEAWIEAIKGTEESKEQGESYKPLFRLLQAYIYDLRSIIQPLYNPFLKTLLSLISLRLDIKVLAELMASLLSLLKFVLVPNLTPELLDETWGEFVGAFQRIRVDHSRMLGEVLGAILRRMKSIDRKKLNTLMFNSLQKDDTPRLRDALAWPFIYACQGPQHSLHTSSSQIVSDLLDVHLSLSLSSQTSILGDTAEEGYSPFTTENATGTLLRRLLSSLAHHVKDAAAYESASVSVLDAFVKEVEGATESDADASRLVAMLRITTIPVMVLQGARMQASQLRKILEALCQVPQQVVSAHKEDYGNLIIAVLSSSSSEVAVWLPKNLGKRAMEKVWEDPVSGLQFSGALAEAGWDGWKAIVLPELAKHLPVALSSGGISSDVALRTLIYLVENNRLDTNCLPNGSQWWGSITDYFKERLKSWTHNVENTTRLIAIAICVKALPASDRDAVATLFVDIIDSILSLSEVDYHARFLESPFNEALVVSVSFATLAGMDSDAVRSSILPKLDRWLEIITSSWTWSPDVLNSIHILCKDVNHKSTIQQDVLFSRLRPCIMSHHAFRRIRALHLLFYNANLKNDSTSNSVSPSSLLLQSMIAADDSVLEVSAVRERIFRTTNVGATIRDDAEVSDVQLAGMWLLAQLKVNLQPLWKPTVESFASLMERFPETLWQLSFSVLKLVGESVEGQDPSLDPVPVWSEYFKDQGIIRESIFRDDQNTWTDSSAHRLVGVGRRWRQQLSQVVTMKLPLGYGEYDRLDLENFETQILAIFAQASTIAKKHSYELSPYSLSVMRSGTTSHRRLKAYLSMIAKLPNPRTLHSSSELYSFYFSIVAAPNHYLQSVALDCILAHRPPAISPYGERLRNVIDETKWRDELLSFKLDRHIEPEHRAEFVHLLICLLYRRLVEKRARHSKGKRPVAAYGMLNTCTSAELRTLVNLMLQPFPMRMDSSFIDAFEFQGLGDTNLHKQSAFLDLLSDVHKYLGAHMTDHWPVLLGTTLEIINNAERLLSVGTSAADVAEEEEEEEPEAALDDDQLIETETQGGLSIQDLPAQGSSGLLRSVRQKGLRCFNSFFVLTNGQFDFLPYMGSAFQSFIIPRIRAIGENSRVPILLIDVLLTFSKSPLTSRFLVDYDADLLPTVFQSLDHPDTKPMEIMKVLDLAQAVVEHAVSNPRFAEDALLPNVTYLMERLTHLAARRSSSSSIVERQFGILSSLSPFIQDPSQAERLFRLILSMLWKSLPETRQLSLIQIMETLVQFVPDCQNMSSRLGNDAFQCISRLFQSSCERTTRDALVAVFRQLCGGDSSLETTAKLVDALNSYLNTKDIPDFERRLNAFSTINEDAYRSLSHTAWLPILYNMLFFVEDRHEFSIRINAGLTLRRFIDRTSAESDQHRDNPFTPTFRSIIYPSLCRTIRCKTENARMEALKVIGHAVEKLSGIPFLKELQPLIGDTGRDSFFHNLYHSQKQPRIRAIRKLITQGGNIRATTISALLLPLLSHFLDVNADRDVQDMSVVAFGSLSRNLAWDPYLGLIETRLKDARLCNARKRGAAKIHLRTVNAVIDNFPFTLDGVTDEGEDEDADGEGNAEEGNVEKDEDHTQKSQPDLRIADAITGRLLPALFRFMDKRDPKDKTPFFVATSIVRMCNKLPETTRQTHAARLITILSQALRTKIEPIRVFVRATLCRISTMLGNSMLPVLFRELRHALVRGSHLHVLAHVTHTLLFHVTSREHAQSFGSLDAATEAVAHIAFEVVFGQSAERSESEGLRAAYREVLGAVPMGVQLFGIMAQQISSSKIRPLLEPIRALLHETESGKILQKIDEILGRIASGLNANKYLTPTDILSLCHTLLTQNAQFLRGNVVNPPSEKKKSDVDVQLTRHVAVVKDLYSINSHKFVALGLNLFNAATNRFDIKDLDICSRLDPLVVAISPTLHSPHNVVLLPSLRASATILRFPLPSVSDHLQAYVQQILLICRKDGSTESEVVQMALRTIASVMRDCPESVFEEADISFILELIAPDLEELDREDAIFTILRAIVSRKFVAHEIYDIMDKIAERMVTSQSQHSRSICRKLTLQFVLDYPHGTNRLKNTMTSLAKNLSYTFESGRISTLELLLSLFSVIQLSLLCEYAELFFLALVMLLANDDSSKCREKGAMVMKVLLQRLDETILKSVAVHLQKWVQKTAQPSLVRTAAQIYGIIAGAPRVMRTIGGADFIVDDLNGLLVASASTLGTFESRWAERLDVSEMDVSGLEWQVPYQALTSLNNLVQPKRTPNEPQSVPPHIDDIRWNKVTDHLLFPHAWVRLASARLLGSLFSVSPIGFPDPSLPSSHPSSREGSVDIAKKLCLQLRSHHLDDKLGLQIVKNLFYLGRCFTHWPEAQRQDPATDTQDSQVPGELTKEDDLKRVVYPLPWLFSKLSFQARRALDRKRSGKDPSEHHMSSILKWFAAMVDFMSPDDVEKYLNDILSPLYLVMRTGARNERMVELQNLSEELQDMLQAKVGTTKFTRIRNSVRQGLPKKFGAGRKATVKLVVPKKKYLKRKRDSETYTKIKRHPSKRARFG